MKRKSEVGKQIEMFDKYNRALVYTDGGGTAGKDRTVVDFLSELREQRASTQSLLTKIVGYENLKASTMRVKRNKGIGGVDGRGIEETIRWLGDNYEDLRQSILKGTFDVSEVLRVEITKPTGGTRELGIPTVLDRIIQQAIHQQLKPLYDRHFSESSFGFRSNRNAHMAVRQASIYVEEGLEWVVDIDLEKYFDTIPHDRLMQRLSKGIGDKRLLRLIHQYLKAGLMKDGLSEQRTKGSPPRRAFITTTIKHSIG